MVRHNNVVPNAHFHKDWDRRVKTWFNQPARKLRRRLNRQAKATRIFPKPVAGAIRPVVHACTAKYSSRVRAGRGFTLAELQGAGLTKYEARQLGVAVDYRRKNQNEESLKANIQRLKVYRSKLVIFPRHANKGRKGVKKGEKPQPAVQRKDVASAEEVKVAVQQRNQLPFVAVPHREKARAITADEKKASAYTQTVKARLELRNLGKKAKEAAEGGKPAEQ